MERPSIDLDSESPKKKSRMSETTTDQFPKATLYIFKTSIWSSVPLLGLIEKGYNENEYNLKEVDLFKGENFCPEFLRLNPKGTVPLLVVPVINPEPDHPQRFKSITDSERILDFLDLSRKPQNTHHSNENPAPTLTPAIISTKFDADRLINLIQDGSVDLNFLKLGSLIQFTHVDFGNDETVKMKEFFENRIRALETFMEINPTATNSMKAFWKDRLKADQITLSILASNATEEAEQDFLNRARKIWRNCVVMLTRIAQSISSNKGDYILGEQISLVDLHAGAWIVRLFYILGFTGKPSLSFKSDSGTEVYQRLVKMLQAVNSSEIDEEEVRDVCDGIIKYWNTLSVRESFKKVYVQGFH
ncbi:uncharacterized protein MELLADRAFT_74266 [Melampsora larici-populina 98AG31]|uniref:GST N-terminal domain-containing protein n=1 Tax=Melampsora larici-populina (strain 98AG31 / pathotype 3-4-7) TaxID=747676 RepID=F4RBX1_MELLP|nr:uncharacterized protein MELLADRAFT_74266 [Melampsora larici-populina 98AG31]EGG10179.1 hypothetical protein MELLADRAFT_74266 [Melampsora larici-populina 98AG31]